MKTNKQRIGEFLVSKKWITSVQLKKALKIQIDNYDLLGLILIKNEMLSEEKLIKALEELGVL
jgi:hypothetical protein